MAFSITLHGWTDCVCVPFRFLSRVSILTRDIDIANLSVRPSVRPLRSGTRWKRLNISSQFFHHPVAQSFCFYTVFYEHQAFSQNYDGVTPCGGNKYMWGIKISRFSTNKSLYLANDTRYRHSYYGKRIGTRMRSIKMVPFPMTLNEPQPCFQGLTTLWR